MRDDAQIVFLDARTLGLEDVPTFDPGALGRVVLHDLTSPEELVERARGAVAVVTNKVPIREQAFAELPDLRYVGVAATGTNIVDTASAKAHGVVVTNVPAYSTDSVAQLTIGLIIELGMGIGEHSAAVRAGDWEASSTFSFWRRPLVEWSGKTLGIIGYGTIGRAVGRIATAMGMRVIALDRGKPMDVEAVPLEVLLQESDVVSLHCPQTPENAGMVDAAFLRRMKPGSVLVNTARGGLIVEADLEAALSSGHLAGAALDVLAVEPPASCHRLLRLPNVIATPHIAWATVEARRRLVQTVVENLEAFFDGRPQNVVNL